MYSIRFSTKFLLCAVGVAAALCSIPAAMVQSVRNENAAGEMIEKAAAADMRACGENPLSAVSWMPPPTACRRLMHRLANSKGCISQIDIRGDRSARAIASLPVVLRDIQDVRLLPAGKADKPPTITQLQIDALSNVEFTQWLVVSGRFAPNLHFDGLSRLTRLGRLDIEVDSVPAEFFQALSTANLDMVLIVGGDDPERNSPLPADAVASFSRLRCADVTIFGAIDDLALEQIARTPGLNRLEIECPILAKGQKGITETGIKRACRYLHVQYLGIGGDYNLSAAAADALASITELQSFNLIMTADCRERLFALRPDLK